MNDGPASADALGTGAPNLETLRRQIHSLLKLGAGSALLDVGCGRGEDLIALAGEQLPGSAALIGVDASEASIKQARSAANDDDRISFLVHDVSDGLPFATSSFDAVLSINTLEAIPDKGAILREMHRVLRPGGTIVVAHFDWDSQLFDGFDKATIRSLIHAYADWQQAWMADCDAWMGRRLWRTMNSAGLFEGSIHPLTLVNTSYVPGEYGWEQAQSFRALIKRQLAQREDVQRFLDNLEELHRKGEYFFSIAMFVYVGTAC